MNDQLYQWDYSIQGLIPEPIKLKQKIWLKKGELFLDKSGESLKVHLLGDEKYEHQYGERITQYLRIASLVSRNSTELIYGGGHSLRSKKEFGKKPRISIGSIKWIPIIPDEIASDIEEHTSKFIRFIGKLHDDQLETINSNSFVRLALTFYYASAQSGYSSEGFLNSSISLESLFNDGPSDISYKLVQRASFLLGLYGINPIETSEKLKSLYKIRSKIVGNPPAESIIKCNTQPVRYRHGKALRTTHR